MNATEPSLRTPLARLGRALLRRAGVLPVDLPPSYAPASPWVAGLPAIPPPAIDPLSLAALDAAADEAIAAAGLDRPVEATGLDALGGLALTRDNVEAVLDEMVRPALNADGGDIHLLDVRDNDVYVKLVGACSTCPSSIMTMKMGVERLLQDEFPSMGELIQVDGAYL